MYNGENEIVCPNDKYIKHYLWRDYFHVSKIKMIEFNNSKGNDHYCPNQVILTVESSIDIDTEWDKLKGTNIEKKAYITNNKSKYMYNLYFRDCKYFNYEKSSMANDYINGRFKDTAKLQKINKATSKVYYHFRIATDDGYIDIIFSKFKVKKAIGRINIKDIEINDYHDLWLKKYNEGILVMDNGEFNKIKLLELLSNGDDIDRYYVLYYFMNYTAETIINYARGIMQLEWDDFEMAKIMAISIIGKVGNRNDLPILFDEYFTMEERLCKSGICYCSTLLPKRHVMDAIEEIKYRENEYYDLLL